MIFSDVIDKCSKEILVFVQTTNSTSNNFTTFFKFGPYFVKTYKKMLIYRRRKNRDNPHQLLY